MNNPKNETFLLNTFKKAFVKLFKCNSNEVEIRIIEDNQLAIAIYKGEAYRIATKDFLYDDILHMLTDIDQVHKLDLNIWIDVTKNSIMITRFLTQLVKLLTNFLQAQMLQTALIISSFAEDDYASFWHTLQAIDKEGTLLGNAIISAAAAYNANTLSQDILELNIINGKVVYNQIVDGVFEEVIMPIKESDDRFFYIYSVGYVVIE